MEKCHKKNAFDIHVDFLSKIPNQDKSFFSLLHICNEYNTFILNTGENDNIIIIEKISLNK